MRFLALLKRELTALLLSPIATAVGTIFLFFNGILLVVILLIMTNGGAPVPASVVYESWVGGFFTWMLSFILIPAATMRLLSEERRHGSLELLLTAPVSDLAVVLSKWLGALLFYLLVWTPALLNLLWLRAVAPADWRALAAVLLFIAMLGALGCAVGLFCSALTSHVIIAALATTGVMLAGLLLGFLSNLSPETLTVGGMKGLGEGLHGLFQLCNVSDALKTAAGGVVDSRQLVFQLSLTALFLLLTHQLLAARRYRG